MNPEPTNLEPFLHVFRKHFTWFLFVFFFLLYAATAQRGVSWQDSGEFQYRVLSQDYFWISGIARAHPAYIAGAEYFVSLFPKPYFFYAMNLFSGLGMSLALLFLARILSQLKLKQATILITVMTLGLSHMVWWMSTIAEVYTWSLAFLMAELLCVAKFCHEGSGEGREKLGFKVRGWMLLALLNGLHASLHNFAFLNLPVYALLFVYLQYRKSIFQSTALLLLASLAWFLGAVLLMPLFYFEWTSTRSFMAAVNSLLFGREFEDVVKGTRSINWPLAKMNLALASISLLNPAWLFAGLAGRTCNRQGVFKMALLGLTVIHVLFCLRYFVPDQATFILPSLALLALWVGIGLDNVMLQRNRLIALACVVLLSSVSGPLLIHQVLLAKGGVVKRQRALPFREEISYWLYPWKHHERSAVQFLDHAQTMLKAGDIVIADNTAAGPLMATQAAGLLTANIRMITFFTGETDAELVQLIESTERVYIVSPVAGYASNALLTGRYTFEKEDVLYRVRSARHE